MGEVKKPYTPPPQKMQDAVDEAVRIAMRRAWHDVPAMKSRWHSGQDTKK